MRGVLAGLLLAAATAVGAPPEPVTFPPPRAVPSVPPPRPLPAGNPTLTADLRYVFDVPADASVRTYPPGLVSFEKKKGPRDITARFYGGTGAEEDRSFAGPWVWVGKAVGTGEVTVVVTPFGLKADAEIKTDTFRVDSGIGPQPPPDPKPDPKPGPLTPVVWVVVVEESSARTPETARVLNDLAYWKALKARGIDHRTYDKDSPDAKAKGYDRIGLAAGIPCVVLLDAQGKNPFTGLAPVGIPLPATTAGIDGIIRSGK